MYGDLKSSIRADFKNPQDKKRNFSKIRGLFDLFQSNKYTIDDQTWDDLTMNEVFTKIDRTYSTAGEAVLYTLLRNPVMDEEKLKKREKLINLFKSDLNLTTELRKIFFKMGFDKKNRLLEMIEDLLTVNRKKYYLYSFLGKILPIALIVIAIFLKEPRLMIILMVVIFINIYFNQHEATTVRATGLIYLRDVIDAAKKICKLKDEGISEHVGKLEYLLKDIKILDSGTRVIKYINAFGGLFEAISIPFLLEEAAYYNISSSLKEKASKVLELYYLVGELDALIGVSSYISCNEDRCSAPKFIEGTTLSIIDGIHPLLKEPVPNSIQINNNGIVLTGTNMSGKSTFLRMISTNILLAQTFNFVLAKEYKACFLNIVSSISPKDDINNGKSYYMAEAEAILRIIRALDNDVAVFCPIDEIFRGTNPVERISSSAEILNYINKRDALCIVATHDRELTDMLKDNYNFYYFSEDVDSKEGLSFDYKLKAGISKTKNAIKLLDYIGYPKEIIKNAYKRAENMEKYI
ncbi:MutS-related protein [Clostridium paraputrificum]|uniref:MutS-related protein n=1 Tax=Clostridium TaxID=1485 RepID=UPI003D3310C3